MDASLLLRILGDPDDAQEALRDVARDMALLARQRAKATVEVATAKARAAVESIRREIASLDGNDVDVDVDTAAAQAQLLALEAQLAAIDRGDITVDVHVREEINRDVDTLRSRIAQLATTAERSEGIFSRLSGVFGGENGLGSALSGVRTSIGPFSGGLGVAAVAAAALIPIVVSLAGAVAALVSSLAAALGAIGALAVAFGATLAPAIVLGIGAVARFKDTVDKAGTAAHELARVAGNVSSAFQKAVAPGADAVFRGLADALRSLRPLVESLRGPLTKLGQAAGDAFRTLGREFGSPVWQRFFAMLADAASRITPILTRSFIALANILADIAEAAMPFVVRGLRAMADALEGIADNTSNIDALRGAIGGLVGHLQAWLDLIGQIGRVFIGFFRDAAPAGQELVQWLADGAESLADWLNSAEGADRIQQFFDDTIPLAKSLVEFFGKLALALIQIGQLLAPVLKPFVDGLNEILDIVNGVLNWLNQIPASVRGWIGTIASLVVGFGKVKVLIAAIIGLFGRLGSVGSAIWGGIKGAAVGVAHAIAAAWHGLVGIARGIFNAIRSVVVSTARAAAQAARGAWNALRGAARSIWNGIKSAISTAARGAFNAARSAFNALRGAASNAFNAVRNIARSVFGAVRNIVSTLARAAANAARSAFNSMKSAASAAFHAIVHAAGSILRGLVGIVKSTVSAAVTVMASFASAAFNAGRAVVEGFISGIQSLGQAAIDAAENIAGGVVDALRSALSISSPSRVTHEMGRMVALGLANGIIAEAPRAFEAARSLGDQIRHGISLHLGELPTDALKSMKSLLGRIKGFGPKVRAALAEFIDLGDIRRIIDNASERVVALGRKLRDTEKSIGAIKRKLGKEGLSDSERSALQDQLAALKSRRDDLSDAIKAQTGKIKDARKDLADALRNVLQGALSDAAGGVEKLKGLGSDLMEAIQRIFAEGATGFTGGAVKSGDLAGSIVEGLPVQEWLQNLVGEINTDMGATLDDILAALRLGSQAGGFGRLAPAAATAGASTTNNYAIHVPAAPNTGGPGDPRIFAAQLDLELRRHGKGRRT